MKKSLIGAAVLNRAKERGLPTGTKPEFYPEVGGYALTLRPSTFKGEATGGLMVSVRDTTEWGHESNLMRAAWSRRLPPNYTKYRLNSAVFDAVYFLVRERRVASYREAVYLEAEKREIDLDAVDTWEAEGNEIAYYNMDVEDAEKAAEFVKTFPLK